MTLHQLLNSRVLWTLAAACLVGCGEWTSDPDGFTEEDLRLIRGMGLTGPARDASNELVGNAGAEQFGQMLFFDRQLSVGGSVSCADCHSPNHWFSDPRPGNEVSVGVKVTKRNSPSLVNVASYTTFGWDGRADTLWGQSHQAYAAAATMAGTPLAVLNGVRARYSDVYGRLFPTTTLPVSTDDLTPFYKNVLKSWAAYLTRLTSTNSAFDRFAMGEREALTAEQRRGLKLFIGKAGCIECHHNANFSDNLFHSVGIGGATFDTGRAEGLTKLAELDALGLRPDGGAAVPSIRPQDTGLFRTKSLRQVSETAPYFHAGQAATLKDVVWFYAQGGDHAGQGMTSPFLVPLDLSNKEQAELVAFLESLTGDPVDPALRCDSSRTASDAGVVPICGAP